MKYPQANFKYNLIKSENERRNDYVYLLNSSKLIKKISEETIPNFNEEVKLWKKGYKWVIGLDEAGRGPLAGPVVAGAVLFEIKNQKRTRSSKALKAKNKITSQRSQIFKSINDSKKLTSKQREEVYNYFRKNSIIKWGIGIVSEKVIDKINILEATKLAMIKAVKDLEKKLERDINNSSLQKIHDRENFASMVLIIDGNIKLDGPAFAKSFVKVRQKSIIKADQKVFSCSLASIFAKVTRDKIMQKYHKKYPKYCFDNHKGYGTSYHFKMIEKYGPCKIHRKSFEPVKSLCIQIKSPH